MTHEELKTLANKNQYGAPSARIQDMASTIIKLAQGYLVLSAKLDEARTNHIRDTLLALKNYGADTECGACMEIAFTGMTMNQHDCGIGG